MTQTGKAMPANEEDSAMAATEETRDDLSPSQSRLPGVSAKAEETELFSNLDSRKEDEENNGNIPPNASVLDARMWR